MRYRAEGSYFGIHIAIHDCAYVATSTVIYTINTRDEFRNVSVTEAELVTGWPLHGKQT